MTRKKGIFESPITVNGTNIEIIRPYDGTCITTVVFDFDGTLSRERDGCRNLMVATNSAALIQGVPSIDVDDAINWVIRDIEDGIGIPLYVQMQRLSDYIAHLGGRPSDPQRYKDVYNHALDTMVNAKYKRLERGEITQNELRVLGAPELLELLNNEFPGRLYLASGTDIGPIRESVRRLGFEKYFGDNIVGGGSTTNPADCAKQMIIDGLSTEHGLKKGQLLCFGDGFPEIHNAYKKGGICVGVLTPDGSDYEYSGHFTVEGKRKALINAGAHILVPDFKYAADLVRTVGSNYR